mmetsp:Transcript_19875/g.41412  ORF Transcript_19875/g.41412 Transcript_19875/m.41412 type:complete len:209 (-) Transcript_19875:9-635(-)
MPRLSNICLRCGCSASLSVEPIWPQQSSQPVPYNSASKRSSSTKRGFGSTRRMSGRTGSTGGRISAGTESKYLRKGAGRRLSEPMRLQSSFHLGLLFFFFTGVGEPASTNLSPSESCHDPGPRPSPSVCHAAVRASAASQAWARASQSCGRRSCCTSSGGSKGSPSGRAASRSASRSKSSFSGMVSSATSAMPRARSPDVQRICRSRV